MRFIYFGSGWICAAVLLGSAPWWFVLTQVLVVIMAEAGERKRYEGHQRQN